MTDSNPKVYVPAEVLGGLQRRRRWTPEGEAPHGRRDLRARHERVARGAHAQGDERAGGLPPASLVSQKHGRCMPPQLQVA